MGGSVGRLPSAAQQSRKRRDTQDRSLDRDVAPTGLSHHAVLGNNGAVPEFIATSDRQTLLDMGGKP
jgi:hypothetical protein